jgi:MarR family transcriptional regulator, lower aerobic nicotinate degradation pathway regulator
MSRRPGTKRATAPIEALHARPGFLLRRAHQIASGVFERECGAWGLTQAQHGALLVAACCPGMDQTGIGLALGFDRATTGEVLRALAARALIERLPSRTDARRRSIVLTRAGRRLLGRAAPALERAQSRLLAPLPAAERAQLLALLVHLCEAFNGEACAPLRVPQAARA